VEAQGKTHLVPGLLVLFVTAKGTITVQATNPAPNAKEKGKQATDCHARAARELGFVSG